MWRAVAVMLAALIGTACVAQGIEELTAEQLETDVGLLEMMTRAELGDGDLQALADVAATVEAKQKAFEAARDAPGRIALLKRIREALIKGEMDDGLGQMAQDAEPLQEAYWQAQDEVFAAMDKGVADLMEALPEPVLTNMLQARGGEPAEHVIGLLHESRHIPPAEFANWAQQVSHELAMGLAHGDPAGAETAAPEIEKLLTQARELTTEQLEAQTEAFRDQLQALSEQVGPMGKAEAREGMTREMLFDLLGNPRLAPVLEAKLNVEV